ncbi:DsbC family protein [bacterium]|nr:MAG: DsbC family protein [bacterium]
MNKNIRFTFIIIMSIVLILLLSPQFASAFGGGGCGEGSCQDCHGMKKETAAELLNGLVDRVDSVDFAEVPGLYVVEVTSKGKKHIVYIDFSEAFVIAGNVVRIADRSNITRQKLMELRRVDLTTVPLEDTIVLGNPAAAKKAFVFTDPQCPYCKKLHPELRKVVETDQDIVFFIKLFPLVKLHPDSARISRSVICADSLELLEDSFTGKQIPDPTCETDAIDRTIELARELGITSTPTMILPDGRVAPGYKKAEDILQLINGGSEVRGQRSEAGTGGN